MKRWLQLLLLMIGVQWIAWGNSVNLYNNTPFTLRAEILAADGTVLNEVLLDPKNQSVWTDTAGQFGLSTDSFSQTPYTVNWYCSGGDPFGTCTNVAAGSVVLAMSCGGVQECPGPSDETFVDE